MDDDPDPEQWWTSVIAGAVVAGVALALEFLLQGPYASRRHVRRLPRPHPVGRHALDPVRTVAPGRHRPDRRVGSRGGPGAATAADLGARADRAGLAGPWRWGRLRKAGTRARRLRSGSGLPVTMLHLLAMATWIGGLGVLAFVVLPAAGTLDGARWAGTRAAGVLEGRDGVRGRAGADRHLSGVEGSRRVCRRSLHTTYGVLVLVKIGLFVLLVGLGALAQRRVRGWSDDAAPARRRRTGVLAEILLAVVVLGVSGVLVAERDVTPPSRSPPIPRPARPPDSPTREPPPSGSTPPCAATSRSRSPCQPGRRSRS